MAFNIASDFFPLILGLKNITVTDQSLYLVPGEFLVLCRVKVVVRLGGDEVNLAKSSVSQPPVEQ